MRELSVVDDLSSTELSADHLRASADALTELARLVSSSRGSASTGPPLFVDLVHYQHGYFLSPTLRGFSMLPSAGGTIEFPEPPSTDGAPEGFAFDVLADWAEHDEIEGLFERRASALVTPRGTTEELPFTWATIAGRPVADQVREVLESLASLLVRQGVSPESLSQAGTAISTKMRSVETEAIRETTGIQDSVHRAGWRAAAEKLRLRSEQTGRPLRVRYRATVFNAFELAERAPFLRQAYNTLSPVRDAVDRTTSGMASALNIHGDGPTEVLRTLNDQIEHLGMRQFLAHVVRDSFVCGNGVMVLADVSSGDIRLVSPEDLVAVNGEVATVRAEGRETQVTPVLHLPAGRQGGSELGVSFLEPFVMTCANRDTFLSSLLTSELILVSGTTNDVLIAWANEMKPYAEEQLRLLETRMLTVLGHATKLFADPGPVTYFEGHERMVPSAGRVALVDNRAHVTPYGRS